VTKLAVKAAIFDMDGLLIDSERIIMQACIQAAKDIGITYSQAEFVELIGRSSKDASRIMAEQLNGTENVAKMGQGVEAILKARNHVFPLKPGVVELLQYYQSNKVVCSVASSSPIAHIEHRLSHVGVLQYFSSITSGQEVANGKPSPDIYLLAMQRLGVAIDECVAFEDSEPGARAAIAAGLKVVVVPDLKDPSEFVLENSHQVMGSLDAYLAQFAECTL
jgi:HAD superfamily hydrolase (TIGR01509 family)